MKKVISSDLDNIIEGIKTENKILAFVDMISNDIKGIIGILLI